MTDQRRARRFELALPVRLLRQGSRPISGSGETKNLSSRGVLFTSDLPINVGERIEYDINFPVAEAPGIQVALHCLGKVLRAERPSSSIEGEDGSLNVAATLERYEFVRK